MRKFYLDNVRWVIVFSVLPFHIFFVSNTVNIYGAMPGMENIQIFNLLSLGLYNPWIMPLIFLISGIAAKYSLQKRSNKQFFKERINRLLVPATLGLFVYQWLSSLIITYANDPAFFDNNTGALSVFLKYVFFAVSSTVPLWTMQVLFLCSCILLIIKKIDKQDKLQKIFDKINFITIIFLFLIVWLAAQLLNVTINEHALFMYTIGTCLVMFFAGYYIFSQERVETILEKRSVLLSCLAIITTVIVAVYLVAKRGNLDFSTNSKNIIIIWYIWIVSLAILAFFKKHFNKGSKVTSYMSKISYELLIVHYPILLFLTLIIPPLGLPSIVNQLIIIALNIIISFAVSQVLKRIPIIRYCVFGYTKSIQK